MFLIADSVTSIGAGAFENCRAVTKVTIPDGVTSIEESTFRYCESLTHVQIGRGVRRIGQDAFWGCDALKQVVFNGVELQWQAIRISDGNEPLTKAGRKNIGKASTGETVLAIVQAVCVWVIRILCLIPGVQLPF